VPIKTFLVPGDNILQVVIKSGITEAFKNQAAYPYPVPALQVISISSFFKTTVCLGGSHHVLHTHTHTHNSLSTEPFSLLQIQRFWQYSTFLALRYFFSVGCGGYLLFCSYCAPVVCNPNGAFGHTGRTDWPLQLCPQNCIRLWVGLGACICTIWHQWPNQHYSIQLTLPYRCNSPMQLIKGCFWKHGSTVKCMSRKQSIRHTRDAFLQDYSISNHYNQYACTS
jgi:hypothetical protein